MTCSGPDDEVTWELYRHCGGKEKTLLERHCYYSKTISHDPRLHLDTRSGCWKLTPARKDDSCVYKIWCYCAPNYLLSSTDIRVLDPILISNITSNCSRLGQDIAVSVQYSGEESAVTWEVDGEPLPERYRLIDDNRTLIIPSVQRDDAERTFRVRITNPVSEETRDHRLEIRDSDSYRGRPGLIVGLVVGVSGISAAVIYIVYLIHSRKKEKSNLYDTESGAVTTLQNGSLPLTAQSGSLSSIENGHVSVTGYGPVSNDLADPIIDETEENV
ncbi:PREDICTED: uncharacterized protein LOC108803165 [Nanorana parkeri]|uniref:uncharacterized protein LOC108803165 n=1 Tax=Nanorana parkeri TaxID=125878 RepID=UPI000854FD0C|nr:PREDICTED: uncharacterized protein LOC108803165 [Nanorana parkeri]